MLSFKNAVNLIKGRYKYDMSKFYFFNTDGSCRWMQHETGINYKKYLKDPVQHSNKSLKFYVILKWVVKSESGANLDWIKTLDCNYVSTIDDLPENSGIYITGYDAEQIELQTVINKGVSVIDNTCPWIKQLKKQLLSCSPETHQCILLLDKHHIIYDSYKSIIPDDTILINNENYAEEILRNKNNKPAFLICYTTFRKKEISAIINFINSKYSHKNNMLNGYKKTLCCWTKQGLFEEIRHAVRHESLNRIILICASEKNRSTQSIINEIKDHNLPLTIIKSYSDMPDNFSDNDKIGIIIAPMPMADKAAEIKKNLLKHAANLKTG